MSGIKAVFLDAGGVLVLPDADVIVEELRGVGIDADPSTFMRAHYLGMRGVDRAGRFSWWNYNHAFVDEIGVEGDDVEPARKAVERAYVRMEWHLPIVASMEALREIEARVPVAVVSNSDGTVESILRRRGVHVPTIIDSHHAGVAQPDAAIFEIALDALGVEPQGVVHIGDSVRFDVRGAEAAGIAPLHFDPFSLCWDDDHEHLSSLPDLLARL